MKKHIFFLLEAIILLFTNCIKPEEGGKDNPQPPAPPQEQIIIPSAVDVTPVVPPEGGDVKISFTAAAAWTASVISTKADSWVDVNPKSGDPGPAEIRITTTPNDTYVERNATIQIKCGGQTKDVVLTQKQVDNITVTTDKVELGAEGGSIAVEVSSNVAVTMKIPEETGWITENKTKSVSTSTFHLDVAANETYEARCAEITFSNEESGLSEKVTVNQKGKTFVHVTSVTLDKNELTLTEDEKATLVATVAPEDVTDKSVEWSSDKPEVASVDENGEVTAKSAGTATITVTTKDGGKTATCIVTVASKFRPVTSVTLNQTSASLKAGETVTLTATVNPDDATDKMVTWTTSDATIATVVNGLVTAKKVGTATITAKAGDKTATCTITVEPFHVTGISLDKTSLTLNVGDNQILTVTIAPENATDKTIIWTSSDNSVATVDSNGKVSAIKGGTTTITAKTQDGGKTATCSVKVNSDGINVDIGGWEEGGNIGGEAE